MQTENITEAVGIGVLLSPRVATSSVNSQGLDISNERRIQAIIPIGTVTGTAPTLAPKLQSSPDNSTWTDIPGATAATVTASNELRTIELDTAQLTAGHTFVRFVGTIGGTSPSYGVAVILISKDRSHRPVQQPDVNHVVV